MFAHPPIGLTEVVRWSTPPQCVHVVEMSGCCLMSPPLSDVSARGVVVVRDCFSHAKHRNSNFSSEP